MEKVEKDRSIEKKSWQCERHSLIQDFKGNKILKIEEPNIEYHEGQGTPYLEGERNHFTVDQEVEKIKRLF